MGILVVSLVSTIECRCRTVPKKSLTVREIDDFLDSMARENRSIALVSLINIPIAQGSEKPYAVLIEFVP